MSETESWRWRITHAALWLVLVPGCEIGLQLYRFGECVREVFRHG